MPITFRMTALERKPLVIIYNENINIADIYKRYGYQLPEILSDTKAILASSGLPANSTVIFANKRTEQRYKDPTMVNILEMLEKAGIQLDNDAFKHFQDLLNFPAEIAAEAAVAQEAGLTEEEFYFEKFQDGDRISPLLPGLQQYLERQENQRGRTKPTVIINNDNNMAATESKSKFDLQHAKDNFGVMQAYINAIFEDEAEEMSDKQWEEFVACVKALPKLPDESSLNYPAMKQLCQTFQEPKSVIRALEKSQFEEASQFAHYLIQEWLRTNSNHPSKRQPVSQAAEIPQGALKNIKIREDADSDIALIQRINACTLISVSVIKSILAAENLEETQLEDLIRMAHTEGVSLFTAPYDQVMADEYIDVDALAADLHGISETQAHRQFKEFYAETSRQELAEPANDDIIKEFFANRNDFDDYLEFLNYNEGLITAVSKLLPRGADVNLSTISEANFRRLVKIDAAKPSLLNQFEDLIQHLQNEGVTINSDGHAISLVNRSGKYYSYDSLNGNLCVTQNAREMAQYLRNKISVSSTVQVYHFKLKPVKASVVASAPVVSATVNGPNQPAAVQASRDHFRFYPQRDSTSPEPKSANTRASAEETPVITEPYALAKSDDLEHVQQLVKLGMPLAQAIEGAISDREAPTGNRELDILNNAVSAYLRSWQTSATSSYSQIKSQPAPQTHIAASSQMFQQAPKPALVENKITMKPAQIEVANKLIAKLEDEIGGLMPRFGKGDKKPAKLKALNELIRLNSIGELTATYIDQLRTNKLVYDGDTQKLLDAIHPPIKSKRLEGGRQ